ncbi:hypothetical protein PI125_g15070 [Phytophthora idaei]|nr:hypothetical protein PI125_g15070 [Phytophthora idaei]
MGPPSTSLNQGRFTDRQSFGRSSTDVTEEVLATDLKEKPQPPPQVLSSPPPPAGSDSRQNPPDESPPAKAEKLSPNQPSISRSTVKKKSARSKPSRKKMKAPDSKIVSVSRRLGLNSSLRAHIIRNSSMQV